MASRVPQTDTIAQMLKDALQQGVLDRVFSGAQACFSLNGCSPITVTAGQTAFENGTDILSTTRFDVASLTKLFTATVALALVDDSTLTLDTRIWSDFPLESLLAHESGLPAWRPLFDAVPMTKRNSPAAYEQIVQEVLDTSPTLPAPAQAVYSDLGYIGLGHHLQRITGKTLSTLVKEHITEPLQMARTCFAPELPADKTNVACTENCPWRNRVLQGEVHDDNTWTMGGMAGHAGIFSTAEDMVRFGTAWLLALTSDGIVRRTTALRAVQRRPGGRGLGFDLKSPGASSVGDAASETTFGHLGFTGTSLWIDPTKQAVICLLTNRVHPTRDNFRIRQFRPEFHNLFFGSV